MECGAHWADVTYFAVLCVAFVVVAWVILRGGPE